jgi:hypothetical protein
MDRQRYEGWPEDYKRLKIQFLIWKSGNQEKAAGRKSHPQRSLRACPLPEFLSSIFFPPQ